jgi:hypothetical protein
MFSNTAPANYIPIVNDPFLYLTGLGISNNATTPNSLLNVAVGQCRDSTDAFDILVPSALVINSATAGLNGLDTGTIAASKIYAVIVVYDPVSGNPTGAMITLTSLAPSLPFGYSVYRVIGYVTTDSSKNFLKGQWTAGGTGYRKFVYDIPQATAVTAGSQTAYTTPVDLSALVPSLIQELPVSIYYSYTPAAASHTLTLQGFNRTSSGYANVITSQVANVIVTGLVEVIAELNAASSPANKPEINYKVSSGSDAVALNVAGYTLNI